MPGGAAAQPADDRAALPRGADLARAGRCGGGGGDAAATCWRRRRPRASANGDDGLRGYKARHNLALIYEETGRAAEAEAQWRTAVAENPQFTPGWLRLGELYLKQRPMGRTGSGRAWPGGLPGRRRARPVRTAGPRAARPRRQRRTVRRPQAPRLAVHDRQGRGGHARRLPGVGRRPGRRDDRRRHGLDRPHPRGGGARRGPRDRLRLGGRLLRRAK